MMAAICASLNILLRARVRCPDEVPVNTGQVVPKNNKIASRDFPLLLMHSLIGMVINSGDMRSRTWEPILRERFEYWRAGAVSPRTCTGGAVLIVPYVPLRALARAQSTPRKSDAATNFS